MSKDIDFSCFISFRIGALARELARFFNNQFAEYNITIGQALVLFFLLDKDGSAVKDIAQGLQLDSPAVSRLVDRLLKEDLIIRKKDDNEDRRLLQICLTEKGRNLAKKVLPISAGYNQLLKDNFGDERFIALHEAISTIKKTLE